MFTYHRFLYFDKGRGKKLEWGLQALKAGLLSLKKQPEGDRILGITYEGDLRGDDTEDGEVSPLCLTWEDIQNLKTPFFARAMAIYNDFEVFNVLPHGKGTLDERPTVLEAIKILKAEDSKWQIYQMEKNSNGRKD